jgi:branched-chain amino acid transport system ATP-binding protein
LRSIIGLTPPRAGRVRIAGQDVTGWPPHRIAQSGVGYVPEGRKIFGHLTVEENLSVPVSAGGRWTIDAIYQLFPPLAERRAGKAGRLSGGEQEMLAIARALLVNPRLLLLDEPSQGLAPIIVADLMEAIRSMRGEGIAVLLVEQNALLALRVADRAYVLSDGEVVHAGAVDELSADTEKVKALAGASLRMSAGRAAAG